jgi:uncharacterized membrane protein YeaQ/YmgE (transglycosylase-associated protein family)
MIPAIRTMITVSQPRESPVLILLIIVLGMAIGWGAQAIVGTADRRPNAQSLVAGLVGSFVGGLLLSLIAGDGLDLKPSGIIGSLVGAVIVVLVWNALSRRTAR